MATFKHILRRSVYYFGNTQYRTYSNKGFLGQFFDNIKSDLAKNKEMKENLKKFREEAEKLEQSDALKKAREKYQAIESETSKGSEVLKEKLDIFKDKAKKTIEEAEKTEAVKKGLKLGKDVANSATKFGQTMAKSGEQLGQTAVFKSVSEGVKVVKEEINEATLQRGRLYSKPQNLRMRSDDSTATNAKVLDANEEATDVVMHKDSKFFQSWQKFKDNNQFVTKLFDMKTKYDESDNVVIRATRTVADKITDVFGNFFTKSEMSEVLTEITKMDPTFDQIQFLKDCERDIIPNVLEAQIRGELKVLEDWCHEAVFNTLAHPIKEAKKRGQVIEQKVLDIGQIDCLGGKMMEPGPVLIISFTAQQIMVVRDSKGFVVEGDPEKVLRVTHVWALCRDQTILDPSAAWRVLEMNCLPQEQWL